MSHPRYEHLEAGVGCVRWCITAETRGKDIQVAFGGPADAEREDASGEGLLFVEGAPFKRVQNIVTGRTTYFQLAADADGRAGARAFEGAKANARGLLSSMGMVPEPMHGDGRNRAAVDAELARKRPRCSCGRARRQAAKFCQRCLDEQAAAARAAEPPTRPARSFRRDGWLCVFSRGEVFITPRLKADGAFGYATAINNGRWMYAVDILKPPWRMLSPKELRAAVPHIDAIRHDCYCSSFPDTGCDFCNGTRLPDGAKEL